MLNKVVILLVFCVTIFLVKSLQGQQNDFFHHKESNHQTKILPSVIPDFQVNKNMTDQENDQYFPSIAIDGNGNFVITWVDMREDSVGDIYAQRYNNKNELMGYNFKVNDDKGIALQTAPAVFMDNDGNFVITWEDKRNGHSDIYAKKYLCGGIPMTMDFKVNDDKGWIYQKSPVITGDQTGNFVIAWRDDRDNGYVIYAQRYSFDAVSSGNNIKVRDMGRHDCPPSIASDRIGNFVITWSGKRGSGYEVLAQRFDSNGDARGQNFLVHGDERNDCHPSVACDADGDFVIVWQDMRNTPWQDRAIGKSDIYAQQYSRNGGLIGDNFKINDNSGKVSHLRPFIASDEIGNFIVTWEEKSDFSCDLYVQRYLSNSTPQGKNSRIYNDKKGGFYPSIASDKAGNFVVTWQVSNGKEHDIYARSYYSNGQPARSRFKVNDDGVNTSFMSPSLDIDGCGNFIIVWDDKKEDFRGDIYVQRYSIDGEMLGQIIKINDDSGSAIQQHPSVATDEKGNFVMAWQDWRYNRSDIYAQLYLSNGMANGCNFKVNDDVGGYSQKSPAVTSNRNGNFVIVWQDSRGLSDRIFAQRYSNDGTPIGGNFQVSGESEGDSNPAICISSKGYFIITWCSKINFHTSILAQRYLNDGTQSSSRFKVNDDQIGDCSFNDNPSIATDHYQNFVIAWQGKKNEDDDFDVYAQYYSSDGTPIGENLLVNDDISNSDQTNPSVSDEEGHFVIAWMDERSKDGDISIYAQRFRRDGTPVSNNYQVTAVSLGIQRNPDIKLWNDKIYTTWIDNRNAETGYDVWANVFNWKYPSPASLTLNLFQNYPNPFNSETTISYMLSNSCNVRLVIFNILGQHISTLVNKKQFPGLYGIIWDGKDVNGLSVSSGIFFYTLIINGRKSRTNKMIFIK